MSDTSFAFLQSRCFNVPDALYAPSEDFAQTVTHHMCTFSVMGFCMDAAMIRSVTETGTEPATQAGTNTGTDQRKTIPAVPLPVCVARQCTIPKQYRTHLVCHRASCRHSIDRIDAAYRRIDAGELMLHTRVLMSRDDIATRP